MVVNSVASLYKPPCGILDVERDQSVVRNGVFYDSIVYTEASKKRGDF